MTIDGVSVRAILAEQTGRTRRNSKTDIRQFIGESELKITSLESQISILRDRERSCVDAPQDIIPQIDTLVGLRDRERACVDVLRHIISPIRTLPIELLAEIFELTIDDESHFEDTYVEDTYRISQICSDWRVIAHATPRLWTQHIRVRLGIKQISGRKHYADGLGAWWARSAPLPVAVSFERIRANIDPHVLEHVLRVAPRFRSLHCPSYLPVSLINRLGECRLDNLEELAVGSSYGYLNTVPLALTTALRLRKLNMSICSTRVLVVTPLWAQLTDLTLRFNSLDNAIFDIMAQCTALTRATIRTSGWYVDAATAQLPRLRAPLAFYHLHILRLDFGALQDYAFWGSVSAPALKELHLNFSKIQDRMQSATPLTSFLIQSPNITRLEIQCGAQALTSPVLIEVLGHTPHLTHLELIYPHPDTLIDHTPHLTVTPREFTHSFNDALIEALSYKNGVTPLVPHLHDFRLSNVDENEFATEALAHLFFSRWHADAEITSGPPAVARWRRVEVRGDFYSEQIRDSMEMLQRKGLPLELITVS
ncbi:F-box domain-containing protein [Mycena sanguinolenta]|uniref:F-box domain-containing protein n=1 Tax=Mycena sanguinolenta TaxID=230812 RepID=A0A8H7D0K9_9AGAR|nr:F-box domain-containing protein [Mycena sanguinolenta]